MPCPLAQPSQPPGRRPASPCRAACGLLLIGAKFYLERWAPAARKRRASGSQADLLQADKPGMGGGGGGGDPAGLEGGGLKSQQAAGGGGGGGGSGPDTCKDA